MSEQARTMTVINNEGAPEPFIPRNAITPIDMLNTALMRGSDPTVLGQLMALSERFEANQARKAFDEAIAEAKAKIKPIARNKVGHNSKRYADFAAVTEAIDPILGPHGLYYRFRTAQSDRVSVTCILSHKGGHSEETTLSGLPDKSGSKNDIQAIGSTVTYLQRYTLMAALGLAAGDDDDGKAGGRPAVDETTLSPEQIEKIRAALAFRGKTEDALLKVIKVVSLEDVLASKFDDVLAIINKGPR